MSTQHESFRGTAQEAREKIEKLMAVRGSKTVDDFHKKLGQILWEQVGMARHKGGLEKALEEIPQLRQEFWQEVRIPGSANTMNQELEKAGRVADFLELGELMARDALAREESCGGHFRTEYQTGEGEAQRDDQTFATWPPGSGRGKLAPKPGTPRSWNLRGCPWPPEVTNRGRGAH